jgi:hypothetical protein
VPANVYGKGSGFTKTTQGAKILGIHDDDVRGWRTLSIRFAGNRGRRSLELAMPRQRRSGVIPRVLTVEPYVHAARTGVRGKDSRNFGGGADWVPGHRMAFVDGSNGMPSTK